MSIILTSPKILFRHGTFLSDIRDELCVQSTLMPVYVVSNHEKPHWFDVQFEGSNVCFIRELGRQKGDIVRKIAFDHSVDPQDLICLAATPEDLQMGKNGGALLIAAGWATKTMITNFGIMINTSLEMKNIIDRISAWDGRWWFDGEVGGYQVKSLSDLSGYNKSSAQVDFSKEITQTVKSGGVKLNALLAIMSRSLLKDGIDSEKNLVWGVYPSANSSNNDTEILSDFTHRLRTVVSRVRYAERGEPLFIRHSPSIKRSRNPGSNRLNPDNQIETLHINPFYQKMDRLIGKNVILIDDCTTYGVSFGVAAAFLKAAGVATVRGIALGKFGSQLREYNITITGNPFQPISPEDFTARSPSMMQGGVHQGNQQHLINVLG